MYSLFFDCLNLQNVKEKEDALRMLQSLKKEEVSVVLGWNNSYYNFTDEELGFLPPLIIVNVSIHSFLITSSAKRILKKNYPDIFANYRDQGWYEKHFPQMVIFISNLITPNKEKIEQFFRYLSEKGVYYIEDMLLTNQKMIHMIESSPFCQRTAFWADPSTFSGLDKSIQGKVKGIKLFTDGALGPRTAAISEPYKNGSFGERLFTDRELLDLLLGVVPLGKPLSIHAIGDLAINQVVNSLNQMRADGVKLPKIRMEHCQFIGEETAKKAKDLGIILSMQPNFSFDSYIYKDRLQQHYLKNNNPFRMLIDKAGFIPGEDLILGSDGMPHGAEAALRSCLYPPYAQQKLFISEFTAGYCMPDFSSGHIDLEIDDSEISVKVVVKE
jgi:predicted amidohydrolase YtcJ